MKIKIKELMFLNNFTDQSKFHRPGLNGVFIEKKHMAATDGHCLGCFTGDTGVDNNILIDVTKLLKTNPGLKKLDFLTIIDDQFAGTTNGGTSVLAALGNISDYILEANNYPTWHKVIPSKTRINNTITSFSADIIARFSMKDNEAFSIYTTDGPAFVIKQSLPNFLGLIMPMLSKNSTGINDLDYFKVEKIIMQFNIENEKQTPGRYFTKCDSAQYATHQDIKTQQYYCLYESTVVQPEAIGE